MRIPEKILLFLSRKPGSSDNPADHKGWNEDNALSLLCRVFPNFINNIAGKDILDVGCGAGWQAVMLAKHGARYVLGLDTNPRAVKAGRDLARTLGVREKVEFTGKLSDRFKARFDIVISQNSMEHFGDPVKVLDYMKSALRPNGTILITFGPPWFAPYGSHMQFFTRMPWVNIIFSEKTVMNVRRHFRNDGARRYEEVESGLGKMSRARFERIVSTSGLSIRYRKLDCVKGMNFLGNLPFVRELFVNHVSCALSRQR
ncbi:class I SAM-dependent methyltransferase [bacterium]|nr:class I SAM-dependent methyltransferase [bacterium]